MNESSRHSLEMLDSSESLANETLPPPRRISFHCSPMDAALWRLFPHISCFRFSEWHTSNTSAHCFWIFFEHKRRNHVIQQGLVPSWTKQFTNPYQTIASLLLVLHPFSTHSFEHTIANSIHEPAIGNTGSNIWKKLFANFNLIIAFT